MSDPNAVTLVPITLTVAAEIPLGNDGRIVKFIGNLDIDSTQEEIDRLCDKMTRAGNRQRAINILPTLKRQLEDVEDRIAENKKNLAATKARREAAAKIWKEKIGDIEKTIQTLDSEGYDEHIESGRRGAYQAQGARRSRINTLKGQVDAQVEAARNDDLKYQNGIEEIEREIAHREYGEPARDRLKQMIAECEEAAAGSAPAE